MAVAFVMQSVAGRSEADARITGRCQLDTRMLLELADAANARLDQPADSSLDWIDGGDFEAPISPQDCYSASEVLAGLVWLRQLILAGDKTVRDVWASEWRRPESFTPEGVMRFLGHDLDGLTRFCERAVDSGDRLTGVFVP